MISRSDWEPLPKPTLSPFARGYLSLCRFFTAAVWCVPALRVPLVHSLINHFRQKFSHFWQKLSFYSSQGQPLSLHNLGFSLGGEACRDYMYIE